MKCGPVLAVMMCLCAQSLPAEPINIGSRLELFVDQFLVDRREGVELRLHNPTPREIAMVYDAPYEGSNCGYHTIFRDGDVYRMWYLAGGLTNEHGTKMASGKMYACYAESKDGIHWKRPDLGILAFNDSKHNNIVWTAARADNFAVYKDANPACRNGEQYKALASGAGGLWAYKSSDGLHWSLLKDSPLITKGAFDSLNLAFWDPLRGQYWCYLRDFHNGLRDIRACTSRDFLAWTEPELLRYVDSPKEQLYTNQVIPYYRAPHIFLGFPTRYTERSWTPAYLSLPDPEHRQRRMKFSPRYGTAITDGLFMSSRDGRTFHRWGEAFIRPGIERKHNWLYGDGYQNWGILETAAEDPLAPPELSVYATENAWKTATHLRRYTLRIDGFVSLAAPLKGGEVVTKPLIFAGSKLALNFSTSAAGSIYVEIQDGEGKPIPGFTLKDCLEVFGDRLDRVVQWKSGTDLTNLAGKPIRLRFVMKDADLYAIQFR